MTANQIAYQRNREDRRYHEATERLGQRELAEKNRSARANEAIQARAQAAEQAYKLAATELQRQQLAEAAKHNREQELQARRAMVLGQDLQRQQFSVSSGLSRRQQDLEAQARQRSAEISSLQQQETARSNLAQEMLQRERNSEAERHNMRDEALRSMQQQMSFNVASLDRASREKIAAAQNFTSTTNTVISGLFRTVSSGKGVSELSKLIKNLKKKK